MAKHQKNRIVEYIEDCYKADNRELHLTNFFHTKVEQNLLLDNEELINGSLPKYPVRSDWAETAEKTIAIYAKEKELYACVLFLVGTAEIAEKKIKVISPLLLIPAELNKEDEDYYVKIFPENVTVNQSVFSLINSVDDEDTTAINDLYKKVNGEYIDFGKCAEIKNFFKERYSTINAEELLMFPQLFTKEQLKKHKTEGKFKFTLVPAAGLGIITKSKSTLGVISELDNLTETSDYSRPLDEYLSQIVETRGKRHNYYYVPAILSNSQNAVFDAVMKNNTTLVVGPPGTGKSFTIAALAVDFVTKGKSVLIVSSNNQAVDVISDKIENDFELKNVTVRGGGKRDYKNFLKERLDNILSGIGIEKVEAEELRQLVDELKVLNTKIQQLESVISIGEREESIIGSFLSQYRGQFLNRAAWNHL